MNLYEQLEISLCWKLNNTHLIHLKSIGGGVGKERQWQQNVYVQNLWQWNNSNDNCVLF